MTIHETIKAGIPEALKAKDDAKLRTFRSLSAAMTNEVVAKKRKPDELLTDEEALSVLKRAVNQRKDSIEQFTKAGRNDLVLPEQEELAVIETLVPPMMTREDIEIITKQKLAEMGPIDRSGSGRFIGTLMQELKGRADGGDVKAVVDALLSS